MTITKQQFAGTSLDPGHIGDTAADALVDLINNAADLVDVAENAATLVDVAGDADTNGLASELAGANLNSGASVTTAAEHTVTLAMVQAGVVALAPAAGATALNWPSAASLVAGLTPTPQQYDVLEVLILNNSGGANAIESDAGTSQGAGITFGAGGNFDAPQGGSVKVRLWFTDVSEGSEAVKIFGE